MFFHARLSLGEQFHMLYIAFGRSFLLSFDFDSNLYLKSKKGRMLVFASFGNWGVLLCLPLILLIFILKPCFHLKIFQHVLVIYCALRCKMSNKKLQPVA